VLKGSSLSKDNIHGSANNDDDEFFLRNDGEKQKIAGNTDTVRSRVFVSVHVALF